jgi:hypothetical protein
MAILLFGSSVGRTLQTGLQAIMHMHTASDHPNEKACAIWSVACTYEYERLWKSSYVPLYPYRLGRFYRLGRLLTAGDQPK